MPRLRRAGSTAVIALLLTAVAACSSGSSHLDEELIATQQHTIDVINAAGELPKPVDAADAFDLRFDEVVTEAVAETGASHTRS